MKTIDRPKRCWLLGGAVLAVSFSLFLGACDDEGDGGSPIDGDDTQPIEIQDIIAAPKSADPGDTLLLSAIVVAQTASVGEIPTMKWTATGGAFLEDNEASVRWVAPSRGVYSVTARATNSINTATATADVFVGGSRLVVLNQAGELRLQADAIDLFYLHTLNNLTAGVEVFSLVDSIAGDAVELPAELDGVNNKGVAYAPDLSFEVHSADSLVFPSTTTPVALYLGDFATKTYQRISTGVPAGERYPAFTDADVAPDSRFIAYGGMLPALEAVDPDTFDVFVYDRVGPARQNVTALHTNRRNAYPTWSTDQHWLTFVSDRSGRNQWDLYGMPITGGVINTAQASLVRLSNTGGVLVGGTIGTAEFVKPVMAWNPITPTLAAVGSNGTLYLVATNPTGATQIDVGTFATGSATELAWSPDGSMLAVTTNSEIVTVTTGGSSTSVITRGQDTFNDVAWSPDGNWLVYRVMRATSTWIEALDLTQATTQEPLPLTGAEPGASATLSLGTYRALMKMRPVWGTANVLYYPTFATGTTTVGIRSVDVGGLLP